MRPRVRSKVFRRMEALFGLVPSFLKRLEDTGAILGKSPPPDVRRQSDETEHQETLPAHGKVVCRYGPNEVRRPVGGDRRN